MFLYYLSSVFICGGGGNEPDEEVDSDEHDVHEQVLLLPGEHIPALYKQEQHMSGIQLAAKSHGKNSMRMLLEKIILLISYILMIKLFV